MVRRCSEETLADIQLAVARSVFFIEQYRWIIDAYVSDFFTENHWQKLQKSWTDKLAEMEPQNLSFFLTAKDEKEENSPKFVLPLSLLAFKKCSQSLSLSRKMVDLNVRVQGEIFPDKDTGGKGIISQTQFDPGVTVTGVNSRSEVNLKNNVKDGQFLPLHHCLRRHVKPKKQHEILQLGHTLNLLGQFCNCRYVVDVGAGQGHLSRLLTFGYGFKVTTVEAVGCHASRAKTFDKNAQELINKRKLKRKHDSETDNQNIDSEKIISDEALPDHVTCIIQPDTSMSNFLEIVQHTFNKHLTEESSASKTLLEEELSLVSNKKKCLLKLSDKTCSITEAQKGDCLRAEKLSDKICDMIDAQKSDTDVGCLGAEKLSDKTCDMIDALKSDKDVNFLGAEKLSDKTYETTVAQESDKEFVGSENIDRESKINKSEVSDKQHEQLSNSCADLSHKQSFKATCNTEQSDVRKREDEIDSRLEDIYTEGTGKIQSKEKQDFILTGLHACGDLTSTMLRVFAKCPDICGLASVGCCYMKITCQSESSKSLTSDLGYPLSQFVGSLQNHHLSYEAREMACHFADSYAQRLKDDSTALKLHCYRAALQYIIKQKKPDFNHGCVKLHIKNAEKLSFEKYATESLKRLGIDENISEELLQETQSFLPLWKNVVAFYTLRLSLAPVVESLILMDRMLYLYEQGIGSSLVPVFDPSWSPRNFVLLAKKYIPENQNNQDVKIT